MLWTMEDFGGNLTADLPVSLNVTCRRHFGHDRCQSAVQLIWRVKQPKIAGPRQEPRIMEPGTVLNSLLTIEAAILVVCVLVHYLPIA